MNSDSVCSLAGIKSINCTKAIPEVKKGRDVNDTQPVQKGFCAVQIIAAAHKSEDCVQIIAGGSQVRKLWLYSSDNCGCSARGRRLST